MDLVHSPPIVVSDPRAGDAWPSVGAQPAGEDPPPGGGGDAAEGEEIEVLALEGPETASPRLFSARLLGSGVGGGSRRRVWRGGRCGVVLVVAPRDPLRRGRASEVRLEGHCAVAAGLREGHHLPLLAAVAQAGHAVAVPPPSSGASLWQVQLVFALKKRTEKNKKWVGYFLQSLKIKRQCISSLFPSLQDQVR